MTLHEWLDTEELKIKALPGAGEFPYPEYVDKYPYSTILTLLRIVHLYAMGFTQHEMKIGNVNIWEEQYEKKSKIEA